MQISCDANFRESSYGPNAFGCLALALLILSVGCGDSHDPSETATPAIQQSQPSTAKGLPHATEESNPNSLSSSSSDTPGSKPIEPKELVSRGQGLTLDELLLFQPSKYPDGNWEPTGLQYEDVWLTAADGTKIHAWYCQAEGSSIETGKSRQILYFHGNAGNLSDRVSVLQTITKRLSASVLIFDYRGYGRSEGIATVDGVLLDAEAALQWLQKRSDQQPDDIIFWGRSLGGALAVQLADKHQPRCLILESTFTSLKEIAEVHLPELAWLVPPQRLNSKSTLQKLACPIFHSHGNRDQVIPLKMGRALFESSSNQKSKSKFVELNNYGHNDLPLTDYYDQLKQFLQSLE